MTPHFVSYKQQVLTSDREHEEDRGGGGGGGRPDGDPESRANSFRRLYDVFLFLALAFSVLEALMFRLGRRRLAAAAERRKGRGTRGFFSTGALESLLDEEDCRRAGWEDWPGESVEQVGV